MLKRKLGRSNLEVSAIGLGAPLCIARYAEPFALLIGQLAYEGSGGPELAHRFGWLGR